MTMLELQDKLGDQIQLLTSDERTPEQKREIAGISMTICSLAKQMINNADVMLRTEKLLAEGKLQNSNIKTMLGTRNAN